MPTSSERRPVSPDEARRRLALRAVSRINRAASDRMDATGRDANDYEQLFSLRAWLAEQERKGPAYVFVAVRNEVRKSYRDLSRHPELARFDMEPEPLSDFDLEGQTLQRDLLLTLSDRLAEPDLELLVAYADHDCNAGLLWRHYGCPMTKRGFRMKVRKICLRCQEILHNLERPLPVSPRLGL